MYLTKFTIENIKCFGHAEFDFQHPNGEIKRWNVILGENGTGKSTLLQAIGMALMGTEPATRLGRVDNWVRGGVQQGRISAEVVSGTGDRLVGQGRARRAVQHAEYAVTGTASVEVQGIIYDQPTLVYAGTKKQVNSLKRGLLSQKAPGWFAAGYGPFRRLRGGSVDATRLLYPGQKEARFVTLFREDAALDDLDEWLKRLEHTSRDGGENGQRARQMKQLIQQVLDRLLPSGVELDHFGVDGITFRTPYRTPTAMVDLSDGYRSMLALATDLLRRLYEAFERPEDWIDAEGKITTEGVVLIDEIDAHLHPVWQRQIGFWLSEQFPNLQFIVSTHSPFVPQAADDFGVWILNTDRLDPSRVTAYQDQQSVKGWRADQILTVLFNLSDLRDPETETMMRRHAALQARQASGQLTLQEGNELAVISRWLDENLPPPGDNASEMAFYSEVRDQVEAFLREHGNDPYNASS